MNPPVPAGFGELTLRPFRSGDRDRLIALVESVMEEHGVHLEPAGADADLEAVEANYGARGGCFFVLVDPSGELVGSVGLHAEDASTCELRKLYLVPGQRGRGLGRGLLEHVLTEARARGFQRVILESTFSFRAALRLYRRAGFLAFEGVPHSPQAECMLVKVLGPEDASDSRAEDL